VSPDDQGELRRGTIYGFLAYAIWGVFPLYFHALKPSGAWEILAHRIVWTLVLCLAVLGIRRDLAWSRQLVARPRLALGVTVAALLIAANWVVYVFAVISGRTTEAALGYFLNPIVTVALGVFVLRERLRPLQWAAVAIGAVAGVYLSVAGGQFPLIALSLAFSFAGYGLVKKKVGASLDAMHSLAAETAVLFPIAVAVLVVLGARGTTTFTLDAPLHPVLLLLAGVVTAVPLLLFAAAARRIPLTTVGLLQFITPILQLVCGVVLLGEHMSTERWVGFAIVWVALLLLTVDMLVARPSRRRQRVPTMACEEPAP
jgi:chloramphenicol-sensitive protein RarD